jgi:hypothetical protein
MSFVRPTDSLSQATLILAMASLNWFGIQKIRYFGMDSYVKFLRHHASTFWESWNVANESLRSIQTHLLPTITLGREPFEVFHTRLALSVSNDLDDLLKKWLERFQPGEVSEMDNDNRKWIKDSALLWKEARQFKQTRATRTRMQDRVS